MVSAPGSPSAWEVDASGQQLASSDDGWGTQQSYDLAHGDGGVVPWDDGQSDGMDYSWNVHGMLVKDEGDPLDDWHSFARSTGQGAARGGWAPPDLGRRRSQEYFINI